MAQAGRACDENNDEQLTAAKEQESAEYLANAYGFAPNPWAPYYQHPRIPGIEIITVLFYNKNRKIEKSTTIYYCVSRVRQYLRGAHIF